MCLRTIALFPATLLSKILDKVVLQQLSDHLNATDILKPFQSAYRADHSTETLLLRVTNDLLIACDQGSFSILSLLDPSAAFETLDHNILLKRLMLRFVISGVVLGWLESYLTERNQTVLAGGRTSQPTVLKYGVPQGSVLGPSTVHHVHYTIGPCHKALQHIVPLICR